MGIVFERSAYDEVTAVNLTLGNYTPRASKNAAAVSFRDSQACERE
jgi:hypothetical protein